MDEDKSNNNDDVIMEFCSACGIYTEHEWVISGGLCYYSENLDCLYCGNRKPINVDIYDPDDRFDCQ